MSDLMERVSEVTTEQAIAKIKPMVQVKAYVDVLGLLVAQPEGYDVDYDNFDSKQLTELQDYNGSRFDRCELVSNIMHALTGSSVEYDHADEFEQCFKQVVIEVDSFAAKNSSLSYLDATVLTCKAAISEYITMAISDKKVTHNDDSFWGKNTIYDYSSIATAFNHQFEVDAKIIRGEDFRVDVSIKPTEQIKYGSVRYFTNQYLNEVVQGYCYAWVHILKLAVTK